VNFITKVIWVEVLLKKIITVRVLENVLDFMDTGEHMHACLHMYAVEEIAKNAKQQL